jgi:hypothetical protein
MIADRRELRRQAFAVAAQEGGYLTAAPPRAVGYSYQAQAHHVAAVNWRRVDRGLVWLTEWAPQPPDDLFRWLLWLKRQGVVSHESALSVHGVSEFESPRIHLTVPSRFPKTDDGVVLHHSEQVRRPGHRREGHRGPDLLGSDRRRGAALGRHQDDGRELTVT